MPRAPAWQNFSPSSAGKMVDKQIDKIHAKYSDHINKLVEWDLNKQTLNEKAGAQEIALKKLAREKAKNDVWGLSEVSLDSIIDKKLDRIHKRDKKKRKKKTEKIKKKKKDKNRKRNKEKRKKSMID